MSESSAEQIAFPTLTPSQIEALVPFPAPRRLRTPADFTDLGAVPRTGWLPPEVRVASAVGEGSMAVTFMHEYLPDQLVCTGEAT